MDASPQPSKAELEGRAFLTQRGLDWSEHSILARRYGAVAKQNGFYRPNVTFGALRHTFETIGGGLKDQVVVDRIMGHADHSMAAEYREWIDPQRFTDVTEHVRAWAFG